MMMRKSCPRCHGDLYLDKNDGPAMFNCLQCGRSFAPQAVELVTVQPALIPAGVTPAERAA